MPCKPAEIRMNIRCLRLHQPAVELPDLALLSASREEPFGGFQVKVARDPRTLLQPLSSILRERENENYGQTSLIITSPLFLCSVGLLLTLSLVPRGQRMSTSLCPNPTTLKAPLVPNPSLASARYEAIADFQPEIESLTEEASIC